VWDGGGLVRVGRDLSADGKTYDRVVSIETLRYRYLPGCFEIVDCHVAPESTEQA
jgi:hypothetical protein